MVFPTRRSNLDGSKNGLQENHEEKQIKCGGFKSSYNAFNNIKKEIELFDQNRFLGHIQKVDILTRATIHSLF